jgi:hypothetical protein
MSRLTPLTSLMGVGVAYLSPTIMLLPPSIGLWGQLGYDGQSGTQQHLQNFSIFSQYMYFWGNL